MIANAGKHWCMLNDFTTHVGYLNPVVFHLIVSMTLQTGKERPTTMIVKPFRGAIADVDQIPSKPNCIYLPNCLHDFLQICCYHWLNLMVRGEENSGGCTWTRRRCKGKDIAANTLPIFPYTDNAISHSYSRS